MTNPFDTTDHKRIAAVLAKIPCAVRRQQQTAAWAGVFRSYDREFQAQRLRDLVAVARRAMDAAA